MKKNWNTPSIETVGMNMTEGGTNIYKRDGAVLDGNLVDLLELGSGKTDNTISGDVPGPIIEIP